MYYTLRSRSNPSRLILRPNQNVRRQDPVSRGLVVRIYALIPVRTPSAPQRQASLRLAAVTLHRALCQAWPAVRTGIVHVAYNGPAAPPGRSPIHETLAGVRGLRFRTTHTTEASKIATVNAGLMEARAERADLFLCVDDDIVIPPTALETMVQLFREGDVAGAASAKAPLLHGRSTEFQRLYSYAVRASFQFNLAPKRPTGSFYCLDPFAVAAFPDGCNEGDILTSLNLPLSPIPILSEYPVSLEAEVARQTRLLRASQSIGFERFHDNREFASALGQMKELPSPLDRERFRQSLRLWDDIRNAARALGDDRR